MESRIRACLQIISEGGGCKGVNCDDCPAACGKSPDRIATYGAAWEWLHKNAPNTTVPRGVAVPSTHPGHDVARETPTHLTAESLEVDVTCKADKGGLEFYLNGDCIHTVPPLEVLKQYGKLPPEIQATVNCSLRQEELKRRGV